MTDIVITALIGLFLFSGGLFAWACCRMAAPVGRERILEDEAQMEYLRQCSDRRTRQWRAFA